MSFVNPMLLAGIAVAAVPIILHLIMRQKARHLEFPAIRFIRLRQDANRRRLRLRHLLLLLLRVAAISLLAFALARPSLKTSGGKWDQEAPVAAAMVFDTAARMQYRQDNQSRLESAQETALWLLSQFPLESDVAVLETDARGSMFQVDLAAARARIQRLAMTPIAEPLAVVIEQASALLDESGKKRKELYLFTDLSRAAWGDGLPGPLRQRLENDKEVAVYVIDVGVEEPRNFALGEVRLSSEVLSKNSTLQVTVPVLNLGPGGKRSVQLYIQSLGDTSPPQKRHEEVVELGEDESLELPIFVSGLDAGTHQGTLRIVGEDGLALDDVRYFTVEVESTWRVLIASPQPTDEYTRYFAEALAPEHFRKSGRARFDCTVVAQEELERQSLSRYSAVCVLDPLPLSPGAWKALAGYAYDGGGVAIILGKNATPMEDFNSPSPQELLPGQLLQVARSAGDEFLAPADFSHPLLRAFAPMRDSTPWTDFPVYRFWQFDRLAEGARVIVPYSGGQPAVLERVLGTGVVVTMTTPVSDLAYREPWNLLTRGEAWPFLMLANEMTRYLVGSAEGKLNYTCGETAAVRLAADENVSNYVLETPGAEPQRGALDQGSRVIRINATQTPGQYRVFSGGGEERLDRGFSVNLSPGETELSRMSAEELDEVLSGVDFQLAKSRDELQDRVSNVRIGRELFPWLMVLIAVILGTEHILANRFYRDD